MIRIAAVTGILAIVALFAPTSPAVAQDDESVWKAEILKGLGPMAWVNGEVTHGDRYNILIRGDKCDQAERFVMFYTAKKNPRISEIDGKFLSVDYNGSVVQAKALYPRAAMRGHIVLVHFGTTSVEAALRQNAGTGEARVQLMDTAEFKASDYFDITENIWTTKGLPEAVAAARVLCRKAKG